MIVCRCPRLHSPARPWLQPDKWESLFAQPASSWWPTRREQTECRLDACLVVIQGWARYPMPTPNTRVSNWLAWHKAAEVGVAEFSAGLLGFSPGLENSARGAPEWLFGVPPIRWGGWTVDREMGRAHGGSSEVNRCSIFEIFESARRELTCRCEARHRRVELRSANTHGAATEVQKVPNCVGHPKRQ
jgi:hypothetical protein